MAEIVVNIPIKKAWWLSSNQRLHWAQKAERTKILRLLGRSVADMEPMQRAHIVAHVHYPTRRKADPANAYPTLKALIDGLVDGGMLPDDNAKHLDGPDMRLGEPTHTKGQYAVTLTITRKEPL